MSRKGIIIKILVLEDDDFICDQIKTYFELNDHKVDVFHDGERLLQNAILDSYDIFLFDINTPKRNGIDTLKEIREDDINTPAIFLTAMCDIDFVKQGYAVGCNDYVRKPFNLDEVELRIMQLTLKNTQELIQITSNYKFNLSKMQLLFHEDEIKLNQKEKDIIYILLKNKGSIVKPELIKNYVWEESNICDNTLRTQIKKLRGKLKENFIVNIRNNGYKIEKYE
jgi:DNA-binding response OmpR family regulator